MLLDNSKMFFNSEKIPCIPLLPHENKFATNFQVKKEILNSHFATQCSLLKNESWIPPQLFSHTIMCLNALESWKWFEN